MDIDMVTRKMKWIINQEAFYLDVSLLAPAVKFCRIYRSLEYYYKKEYFNLQLVVWVFKMKAIVTEWIFNLTVIFPKITIRQ